MPTTDHFSLARPFMKAFERAAAYGLEYEFVEFFFRDLQNYKSDTDETMKDAIHEAANSALWEWDL